MLMFFYCMILPLGGSKSALMSLHPLLFSVRRFELIRVAVTSGNTEGTHSAGGSKETLNSKQTSADRTRP